MYSVCLFHCFTDSPCSNSKPSSTRGKKHVQFETYGVVWPSEAETYAVI